MLLHKMFNCKVRGLARLEGCADGRGAIDRHEFLPAFWSSYTKRRSGWVVFGLNGKLNLRGLDSCRAAAMFSLCFLLR
jgi:hypothetical protein